MFSSRNDGLDALLKSRVAEDRQSLLRRQYSQSPSLAFFVLSYVYKLFRLDDPTTNLRLENPNKIRLVCVSDTHNHLLPSSSIPPGDVFIHAGDLTRSGTISELRLTFDWIRSLPHAYKIVIAGNHDTALAEPDEPDQIDLSGLTYLCDEATELTIRDRTVRVFGSPRTPRYGNFAFRYPRASGAEHWERVPTGTDILVTHGPPKGHCDQNGLGCEGLLAALWRVRPKQLVCGHIHAGRGMERLGWDQAQRRWEGVVRNRRATWWEVLVITYELSRAWLKHRVTRGGSAVVVNCAVVGGVKDQLRREAVVIDM
jgi:hypothetical protein